MIPNETDESVLKISTWTFQQSARLSGALGMSGVNSGLFEPVAPVLSWTQDKAILIDLWTGERLAELPLPGRLEFGITADWGRKAYVALSDSLRVAVIDLEKRKVAKLIDGVGRQHWAVSMPGGSSYCH